MRGFSCLLMIFLVSACTRPKTNNDIVVDVPKLPKMGEIRLEAREVNGKTVLDTVYPTIPDFSFIDQNGNTITQKEIEGKVFLADFFFTSCPTICPKLTNTLFLVQEKMKGTQNFRILSHSIDPDHDDVPTLKKYADEKKVDSQTWHLLTGDIDSIYLICEFGYMGWAKEDPLEPGGYGHTGFIVLVDKQKIVRGVYDGTRAELADSIVSDIKYLLNE